jgi:excinuclease ABC subunit C
MHTLQHIRDEAHRFAITGHKHRRDKVRKTSRLEEIDEVGKKRRQQLLNYFGGIQAIKTASVEQLQQVPGISQALAVKIYNYFHS